MLIYILFICNMYFIFSDFDNYHDAYNDFDSGWIWIKRKRDISDQEWRIWLALVNKLIPCTIVHHLISQIIKINNNTMV